MMGRLAIGLLCVLLASGATRTASAPKPCSPPGAVAATVISGDMQVNAAPPSPPRAPLIIPEDAVQGGTNGTQVQLDAAPAHTKIDYDALRAQEALPRGTANDSSPPTSGVWLPGLVDNVSTVLPSPSLPAAVKASSHQAGKASSRPHTRGLIPEDCQGKTGTQGTSHAGGKSNKAPNAATQKTPSPPKAQLVIPEDVVQGGTNGTSTKPDAAPGHTVVDYDGLQNQTLPTGSINSTNTTSGVWGPIVIATQRVPPPPILPRPPAPPRAQLIIPEDAVQGGTNGTGTQLNAAPGHITIDYEALRAKESLPRSTSNSSSQASSGIWLPGLLAGVNAELLTPPSPLHQ